MAVYLGFLDYPKHSQQVTETPNFMAKHKISINNPVQTHYTVEGVQSYAPAELKAIKEREDRLMQGKDGTYVPLKVVLLSDQIIQFDEKDPLKDKEKQKEMVKSRPQTAKSSKPRTNTRNAVSANNQAIVKLEKEVAKRNSLQRKLQKMSNKYKEYFKDVDLKQGLKVTKEKEEQQQQQEKVDSQQKISESAHEEVSQKEQDNTTEDKSSIKASSKRPSSAKPTNTKAIKSQNLSMKKQKPIKQSNFQDEQELSQSKDFSLDLGLDLVMRSTTYSEKLGSAIHDMFK